MRATPPVRKGVVAALYFVAAAVCIGLTRFGAHVAPIWLASPILVYALVSAPGRDWPVLLGLGALAHALANAATGEALGLAAPYLVANIAEAWLAAALIRRANIDLSFATRNDVIRFLAICGIATPACSAALAKIGVTLAGRSMSDEDLILWYLAIGLGLVVFLPLIKGVETNGWAQLTRKPLRLRAALLFGALVSVCVGALVLPASNLVLFLAIPILILIAFDFRLAGAEAGLALTALILIAGVVIGYSPDLGASAPREEITRLQILLGLISAAILPLAAIVEERQRLYESASYAQEEAQQAWGEVIAAEANYRLLADTTRATLAVLNQSGQVISTSLASTTSGYNLHHLEGGYLSTYLDKDGAAAFASALVTVGTHAETELEIPRLRIRGPEDSWHTFRAAIRPNPEPAAKSSMLIMILTPVD